MKLPRFLPGHPVLKWTIVGYVGVSVVVGVATIVGNAGAIGRFQGNPAAPFIGSLLSGFLWPVKAVQALTGG